MVNLKKVLALLTVFALIISMPPAVFATEITPVKPATDMNGPLNGEILVNGETIQAPAPYVAGVEGNIMVPLRAVAGQLGIGITWDGTDQSLCIGANMHIFIGKDYYIIGDGAPITFDPPPEITNGYAYVSLAFLQDALTGYTAYVQDGIVIIKTAALPVVEIIENPYIYNPSLGRIVTLLYNSSLGYDCTTTGIKGNTISPSDGITIPAAEDLIIKDLVRENLIQSGKPSDSDDFQNYFQIREITVEQTWKENKTQLFLIQPHDWVAVFQESKLTGIYSCNFIEAIYLADINNDGKYEIVVNDVVGNGHMNYCISVLDTDTSEEYTLDRLGIDEDLLLAADDTGKYLVIYQGRFFQMPRGTITAAGRLLFRDNQLVVENNTGETALIGLP